MDNWELKNALSNKAETYSVRALENEIRSLKAEKDQLEKSISHLAQRIYAQNALHEYIIQVLIDNNIGDADHLVDLKQCLNY